MDPQRERERERERERDVTNLGKGFEHLTFFFFFFIGESQYLNFWPRFSWHLRTLLSAKLAIF
jgi:hypothetical protein